MAVVLRDSFVVVVDDVVMMTMVLLFQLWSL